MTYHVRPCLVPDTKNKLYKETQSKESSEEAVSTDAGVVTIQCALNWAQWTNFQAEFGCGG